MNIKTLINSIIDLDNENKALKNKLNKYEEKRCCEHVTSVSKTPLDEAKEAIFLIGLTHSFTSYSEPFKYEKNIFNKDTRKFIPFDSWIQGVTIDDYNRRYLPDKIKDNLSNKEIINLFLPYLENCYAELVRNLKIELMNEAKESSED
ncbi:hypothetical protein ACQQ4G_003111 [Listeria monocytogenes]